MPDIKCKGCTNVFFTFSVLVKYCPVCSAQAKPERPREDKLSRRAEERRDKRKGGRR